MPSLYVDIACANDESVLAAVDAVATEADLPYDAIIGLFVLKVNGPGGGNPYVKIKFSKLAHLATFALAYNYGNVDDAAWTMKVLADDESKWARKARACLADAAERRAA
jgi:hypothetical protein